MSCVKKKTQAKKIYLSYILDIDKSPVIFIPVSLTVITPPSHLGIGGPPLMI